MPKEVEEEKVEEWGDSSEQKGVSLQLKDLKENY